MKERIYRALVRENRLLELPKQAEALCLTPGEEIDVAIRVEESLEDVGSAVEGTDSNSDQERFRQLAARLFAEADLVERGPEGPTDSARELISEEIVRKHREIGLKL